MSVELALGVAAEGEMNGRNSVRIQPGRDLTCAMFVSAGVFRLARGHHIGDFEAKIRARYLRDKMVNLARLAIVDDWAFAMGALVALVRDEASPNLGLAVLKCYSVKGGRWLVCGKGAQARRCSGNSERNHSDSRSC